VVVCIAGHRAGGQGTLIETEVRIRGGLGSLDDKGYWYFDGHRNQERWNSVVGKNHGMKRDFCDCSPMLTPGPFAFTYLFVAIY
jgi:hypothetical protein